MPNGQNRQPRDSDSAPRTEHSHRTGSFLRLGKLQRTVLAAAVALFGTAAAIGMVPPDDASDLPARRTVSSIVPLTFELPATDIEAVPATAPDIEEDIYISETRIRSGDTLAALLARLEINEPGLQQFLTVTPEARSIYRLYPGRTVQAAHDANGKMRWLRYIHTPGTTEDGKVITAMLQVEASEDGFRAEELKHDTTGQVRVAMGTINNSLFGATDAAGVPDAITMQMADILSSKIDFIRDLRKGDQFRVVYETRMHEGRQAGTGRVLALEFTNKGQEHNAVWYQADNGSGSYYDLEGSSLKGTFTRTPLQFTRISSNFGRRMHPIHKSWRMHSGVDYAAPTGTPIHATANAKVAFAGWQNGYGNVVILQHHGQYTTLYAHQSRIAPGITKGASISQGQVIGYVGSTGWATGPHLHYEFRIANKPVDPLSIDLPVAEALDNRQLNEFRRSTQPMREQLELLAEFQDAMPDLGTALASR